MIRGTVEVAVGWACMVFAMLLAIVSATDYMAQGFGGRQVLVLIFGVGGFVLTEVGNIRRAKAQEQEKDHERNAR